LRTSSVTKSSNAVISTASFGDLVGKVGGGPSRSAVAVAENDVAGKYRRIAAADRDG